MERLALRTFLCCLLFVVIKGTTGQRSQCGNGWFGNKCQYQCHCLNNIFCDRTSGECSGRCDERWFGPQCQYRDAAYNMYSLLTDGSDVTCLSGGELYQTFEMLDDVMFTWMRIITNKAGLFDRVNMTFISSSGTKVDPKSALKKVYVNDTILELYGELQERFKKITLKFDTPETRQSFCSMQVSSGRNVAIKQQANQPSTYRFGTADKAVDGKPYQTWFQESCMYTGTDSPLYWSLNLSLPVTVNKYTLLTTSGPGGICRLNYFRLKSYNHSTEVQQYDEKNKVNQPSYDVYPVDTSPITSVKLTVSKNFWPNKQYICNNNKPALSFCEMQIFGDVMCRQGKWGRDCAKDCNCQELSETCYISTGMCSSGCRAGFHGPGCQKECLDGRWGVDCRNKCGNCLSGNCNKISGECPNGCLSRYKVPHCVEKCDPGFYGYSCNKACPTNCLNNVCDDVDGTCTHCVAGYQGPKCEQECDPGFYGYNCNEACPTNCLNNLCNNVDGTCTQCVAGYQGPKCELECADGQWGISCENSCDKCLNGKCNTVSGECQSGCVQGYKMPFCVQECDLGFHGYNCIDSCPENCRNKTCNKVDGLCIECEAGYQGFLCDQVCDATSYGQNCSTPCSEKCIDQLCHHITGVCDKCPYGKQISKDCSQDCDAGFHGFNCIQPCPANCQDNLCDNVDGKCTKCVAGYQGLVCNQECDATFYGEDCATQCSDSCIDQLCHHITGVCDKCPNGKQTSKDCSLDADHLNLATILVPVILVLIVVTALIVGLWAWRKRKAQKANSRMVLNNENKDGPDVVLGHGVNLELEDTQPPNVPEATNDHYERISLNVSEGNPANNETENTSRYVNVESPPLNEYEMTGENRESHVYTELED